ncbi:MAG: glycosyltransferase family 4 protein [Bacilli bacterium]
MKILYITAEGFDTPNPNNQMAEVMINEFLNNEHLVHLIQSHRKGINEDIPNSLKNRKGFVVDTIFRKDIVKTNLIKRYLNDIKYAFSCIKYWKKNKEADVVYLQSNPTIVFTILLLKLFLKKVPIVYSIYDVFPGHSYEIGVIKSKTIYNILRIIQKPCYYFSSAILVLSEDMKQKVIELGVKSEKIYVVPAWFDVNTIREIETKDNRFIKKYDIPTDKFYLQFAGTIGYVFNYETVIELAKRLKQENNIIIQIIGEGNVKNQFMAETKRNKLNNIKFYPLQPMELVADVYSACNLCIIPLKKGVIGNGFPSKTPILMACKRVIIASVEMNSYYCQMFSSKKMGVGVEITDYDRLAEEILRLYRSPETISLMANNAYDFCAKNYSSSLSVRKLIDILECVGKK